MNCYYNELLRNKQRLLLLLLLVLQLLLLHPQFNATSEVNTVVAVAIIFSWETVHAGGNEYYAEALAD